MNTTNYIVYRQEDEPKNKNGIWIHHKVYKDLSSPIIVQVYSQGKWQDIKDGKPSGGTIEGVGIKSIQSITKDEYDALEEKDPETIYIVKNDPTNGHEWVDIGMVDDEGYHIVWATKNIGAENPWDAGKYFAWGDTVGYYANEGHDFNWANCPYCDGDEEDPYFSKYNYEDGLKELQAEDDAANVQFKVSWHIPINEEWTELSRKYDWLWVTNYNGSGINGSLVEATNGNSIFLPAAGFCYDTVLEDAGSSGWYWSSSLITDGNTDAWYLGFTEEGVETDAASRCHGQSVRPVIRVKDLSELDITYDIYLGEDKIVDNSTSTEDSNMTNILWEDLVALRDNSKLVPGRYYRITDYNTTTAQENTQPAGHQFDIIVLATDVNKLSEDAKAIMHDNTYDITFTDGITKKCYFYNDSNGYLFVDCNTLLGIDGVAEGEFEINESQKIISTEYYHSYDLQTPDLQYNYFQYSNLEAWEIKYCLDNDTTRFAWAANYLSPVTHQKFIVVLDSHSPHRYIYVRYPNLDSDGQKAWVYDTNSDGLHIKDYVDNGEENFDTGDIIYTKDENPKIGDVPSIGDTNFTVVEVSIGTGVIYRMIDEFENECPYDFKNIQFKRYFINFANQYLVETWGMSGYSYHSVDSWTNNFSIDGDDFIYCYTFNNENIGDVSLNKADGVSYADSALVYKNIITSVKNKVTFDDTSFVQQTLNNVVFTSNENFFKNIIDNKITVDSYDLTFCGNAFNMKIKESASCLIFDGDDIEINNSSSIVISPHCMRIKIGSESGQIFISPGSSDIDISSSCASIITASNNTTPCFLENCKIGSNCLNIFFEGSEDLKNNWTNKDFKYIYIGDGCKYLTFHNNSETDTIKYINVKEGCERLYFGGYVDFSSEWEGEACLTVGEDVKPASNSGSVSISVIDDGYGCYILPKSRLSNNLYLTSPQKITGMDPELGYQQIS